MEAIRLELSERKTEIDSYIAFLKKITPSTSAVISSIEDLEKNVYSNSVKPKDDCNIEDDLKKILKANLYILLYNITEAFLKKSLLNILNQIDEKYTYAHLSESIKVIWLEKCVQWFKQNPPDLGSLTKQKYYANFINELQGKILTFLTDEEKSGQREFAKRFGIPGNVDHSVVENVAREWGVSLNDGSIHSKKEEINDLKEKRNNLAHGNISFSEFGKDLTVEHLQSLSETIFEYLNKVANQFTLYLDNKEYLHKAS